MGDDQFKTKLKRILDMTVFSQLLEMDYEENRKTSSKALYGFIERADKIVEDMEHALIQESCENVTRAGTTISDPAEAREDPCLTVIKDEINTLKDNVVSARTAIIYFYNTV
ncbi:hypothetical protein N7476_004787 [Penicillium atrosanguineum]|uniref:Uncharacterized protein n=1 Tax=Penicillium atrosanguineum TaxID=1132637 RepID=A0A9W9PYM9_9EURO|nr:hypothetical protein N7476_004787 [Penicillium atrosanguineum]